MEIGSLNKFQTHTDSLLSLKTLFQKLLFKVESQSDCFIARFKTVFLWLWSLPALLNVCQLLLVMVINFYTGAASSVIHQGIMKALNMIHSKLESPPNFSGPPYNA